MSEVLAAYVSLWSERDRERRTAILDACWTDASVIIGPGYRFTGKEAVLAEVERFQRQQPEDQLVLTSGFDVQGEWARFHFAQLRQGKVLAEGLDVVEFDDDGYIATVITFWGQPPDVPG